VASPDPSLEPKDHVTGIGAKESWQHLTTRLLDIVISSVALLVFAPVMLIVACAIKLDSSGPVLFRHRRVGIDRRFHREGHWPRAERNSESARVIVESSPHGDRRVKQLFGKPIYLYKFRTMYADSRERFPDLYRYEYHEDELDRVPIKVLVGHRRVADDGKRFEHVENPGNDPRVTRVGRWLRRTSLDELPNFLTVLRGDMSVVGPRPDIAENVRWYHERHLLKLRVKPGVTGFAQVNGRGNLSFHDTNELDVEYVRNRSLVGDIWIIWKTIWVILKRDGAF
jgi:lipopolysaccharide/colanic/teichoic acid biosynthesis glycosyltransferase